MPQGDEWTECQVISGDVWGCAPPPTSDASLVHTVFGVPAPTIRRLRHCRLVFLPSFAESQGSLTRTRIGDLCPPWQKGKPAENEMGFLVPPFQETELLKQVSATCSAFCTCSLPFRAECRFCSSACPAFCLCNVAD